MGNEKTGADGIDPRVVIGSMIIKHMAKGDNHSFLKVKVFGENAKIIWKPGNYYDLDHFYSN